MPGYIGLDQVRLGWVRIIQDISRCLIRSGCQVITCYV